MSVLLEGAWDEELNEELEYSKYYCRNKETDNSRNGHFHKTMHTDYGDMNVAIPRDRNGYYEPQLIKKYQNAITQGCDRFETCICCSDGRKCLYAVLDLINNCPRKCLGFIYPVDFFIKAVALGLPI